MSSDDRKFVNDIHRRLQESSEDRGVSSSIPGVPPNHWRAIAYLAEFVCLELGAIVKRLDALEGK